MQSLSLKTKLGLMDENSSWYPGALSIRTAGEPTSNAAPSYSDSLRTKVRLRGACIPPGRNTAVQFGPEQVVGVIPTVYVLDDSTP
jgi:hypothetical protein